jgi:indole-3-glycerol phosphate synthase
MSDVLTRINDDKRLHVAACKSARSLADVEALACEASPVRGFRAALQTTVDNGGYGLIAEIKKASPSKGLIRADFDPPALARAYQRGGASCLSVLTDVPYFQGSDDYLVAARASVDLPVLRKDFMIDPYQIAEARALGADCILIIVAALDDGLARELEAAAFDWGMDALIEVHNAEELERAAANLKSRLIGINNRNLKTLEVDIATSEALLPLLPDDAVAVAESGLFTPQDLARMSAAGADCFLIGESLMRQDDVAAATAALLNVSGSQAVAS